MQIRNHLQIWDSFSLRTSSRAIEIDATPMNSNDKGEFWSKQCVWDLMGLEITLGPKC